VGYYQTCKIPKPEIGAVTRKRRDLLDAQAERICRTLTRTRDDGRCQVPGCRRSAQHLHHIVYRSKSRRLRWQTANCVWICRSHHALEHAGEITIAGNADGQLVVTGDVDLLQRVRLGR